MMLLVDSHLIMVLLLLVMVLKTVQITGWLETPGELVGVKKVTSN